MLFQCWSTVFDAGQTLRQHLVNAPYLLCGKTPCSLNFGKRSPTTHVTNMLCDGIHKEMK